MTSRTPTAVAVGVAGQENELDLNGGAITLAGTSRGAVLGYQALDSDAGHLVNWGAADAGGGRDPRPTGGGCS